MSELPVRKTFMLIENKIQIEKIDSNLTPSLLNYCIEVYNIYKAMVFTSSIKAKINGMLLDEDFLKNNVLNLNQQKVGTQYERRVLQLYKPQRHLDVVQSSFKLKNLKCKLDKFETQEVENL